MTRRAATGALLLALAAFGLALALALPAPLVTSINLEDQGTPVFLPLHREVLPTTIPTDLTSEEKEYAKSLFGSDILDSFSNSQPTPILSLQTEANTIYAASTDTNHQKMPSRPSPGFFRWLQQRQEKKALEKQLRTFLENEEKFLVEQMNELQQEITQIQSQWTNNYNLQGRVLQQQTALKGQKEVLRHLEKMPTPYRASYYEPSRWQSTPMLITSSSPGKIVFSMDRPMTVVANQDPSPASQADQAKSPYSPAAPAAPTLTASAATDDVVVTPGVPDSLAQFARSQIAGRV